MGKTKKKVYVCVGEPYSTQSIWKILEDEDYDFKFYIASKLGDVNLADEVWLFGSPSGNEAYRKAVELGKDIWIMG